MPVKEFKPTKEQRELELKLDDRHGLASNFARPTEKWKPVIPGVKVQTFGCVRCEACRALNTEFEVRKLGRCRAGCGGKRFRSARPSMTESWRLFFYGLFESWRVGGGTQNAG